MVGASPHMGEPYIYKKNFFETIVATEQLIWGKMCPKTNFLAFLQLVGGFWEKNFKTVFGTPFLTEKVIPIPRKMVMPSKNYFSQLFWKILFFFFFFKLLHKKYSKPHFFQKNFYWFLSPDTPFPSKWPCLHTNGFSQFFQHKLKNIGEVLLLESMLIQRKILWRINFVLIQFSPNALLFEKLQNECKNPSFLHKVTRIRLDHAGTVAKFHIHGLKEFSAKYREVLLILTIIVCGQVKIRMNIASQLCIPKKYRCGMACPGQELWGQFFHINNYWRCVPVYYSTVCIPAREIWAQNWLQ